jgi:sugar lactone lactonase YvrE
MSISWVSAARRLFAVLVAAIGLFASANLMFADLLVSDNFGNQILRFDQNTGAALGTLVSGGQLSGPVGMRLDSNGNLLVSNQNDNRILKYNVVTGAYLGDFYSNPANPAPPGLAGPSDLRFGPDGNLYVANFNGNSISRFDTAGNFLGAYTNGGTLGGNSSFAFNSAGELFVGNFGAGEVLRYDATGNYVGVFASGFSGASGLVFDGDGDLWLTSLLGHQVTELDSLGGVKTQFSTNFAPLTETFPSHILFAPGNPNELWVSLTGAAGVYKYSTDGTFLGPKTASVGIIVPGQMLIVSAVPEPGTGLLLAGTAVLMTGLRRRRAG